MDIGILADIGRVLVGAAFLVSGVRILMAVPMLGGLLAAKGVPYPVFVAGAGGVIEVVLGLAAIAGFWFPVVALLLAAFVVVATVMVHNFWTEDGAQRGADINAVISNVIIVGALIALAGLSA